MINKIFSYSRQGIPLKGEEGREGWERGWLVVGEGEREGARMGLGRSRKIYERRERVMGK